MCRMKAGPQRNDQGEAVPRRRPGSSSRFWADDTIPPKGGTTNEAIRRFVGDPDAATIADEIMDRLGGDRLRLTGVFEDVSIQVTLRRDDDESLFTTRGFRWINKYPFNR